MSTFMGLNFDPSGARRRRRLAPNKICKKEFRLAQQRRPMAHSHGSTRNEGRQGREEDGMAHSSNDKTIVERTGQEEK